MNNKEKVVLKFYAGKEYSVDEAYYSYPPYQDCFININVDGLEDDLGDCLKCLRDVKITIIVEKDFKKLEN